MDALGQKGILALVAERVSRWHCYSAQIIGGLDDAKLPEILDRSLSQLVQFDLSVTFAYPDESEPLHLYDGLRGQGSAGALEAYLKGAYLLDPFFTACSRRVPPGLYRMRELAPDNFFAAEYFNSWEVHPCISMESGSLAEEIGFMANLPDGFMVTYSLMRRNSNVPFSDEDMEALKLVEPVVRAAMTHHWRELRHRAGDRDKPAWSAQGAEMELAFEEFGRETLSPREQMVVQLILRGHSSAAIAERLGITEGTVKNHRKRIYAKLSITSQGDLFSKFIRHTIF